MWLYHRRTKKNPLDGPVETSETVSDVSTDKSVSVPPLVDDEGKPDSVISFRSVVHYLGKNFSSGNGR